MIISIKKIVLYSITINSMLISNVTSNPITASKTKSKNNFNQVLYKEKKIDPGIQSVYKTLKTNQQLKHLLQNNKMLTKQFAFALKLQLEKNYDFAFHEYRRFLWLNKTANFKKNSLLNYYAKILALESASLGETAKQLSRFYKIKSKHFFPDNKYDYSIQMTRSLFIADTNFQLAKYNKALNKYQNILSLQAVLQKIHNEKDNNKDYNTVNTFQNSFSNSLILSRIVLTAMEQNNKDSTLSLFLDKHKNLYSIYKNYSYDSKGQNKYFKNTFKDELLQVHKAIDNSKKSIQKKENFSKNILSSFYKTNEQSFSVINKEYILLRKNYFATSKKSTAIAAALGFIFPGGGHFYAGKWQDGFASFLTVALFSGLSIFAYKEGSSGFASVTALGALAFYSGGIYGGYKAAETANRQIDKRFLFSIKMRLWQSYTSVLDRKINYNPGNKN